MKVSSDSELVKLEVLVRMVWNKWSKGLQTWLSFWSPSLSQMRLHSWRGLHCSGRPRLFAEWAVHPVESPTFWLPCSPPVIWPAHSWPVLPVIWARAGAESPPCFGWNCSWSHCMEKHAALRLITECCFCQPDPSIIKFHLSLSLNGFLSYWWWLPRCITLLGVSKRWHPNFITPSI